MRHCQFPILQIHIGPLKRSGFSGPKPSARIAEHLARYIAGPQFKNPITDVIQTSSQLQDMVKEEVNGHFRTWRRRWEQYQRIHWDGSVVQESVRRALSGKQPLDVIRRKRLPPPFPVATV